MAGVKGRSGGRRPGAGRKPRTAVERNITGNPGRRGRVLLGPGVGVAPVVATLAPVDTPKAPMMTVDEVWAHLSPHALAARTLTPGTAAAFRDLCEAIVVKQMMLVEILADGLTGTKVTLQMDEAGGGVQSVEKKAHTLLSQYRGMMQRVEAGLARFCLAPFGKPIYEAEPVTTPVNPLSKFLKRG